MPRITKVYTRKGDDGTTALGGGQRLVKDAIRIEAYGTVDELNSFIGVAIASGIDERLQKTLAEVQNDLFHLGSDLCILEEDKEKMPVPGMEQKHIDYLEQILDQLSEEIPPLENFILPGGSLGSAHLQVARAVCRRAERLVVTLQKEQSIGKHIVQYLNRLSDLLFVMGRYENHIKNVPEVYWDSHK